MRSILKGFTKPKAEKYELPDVTDWAAEELVEESAEAPEFQEEFAASQEVPEAIEKTPVDYARIQAEAILADARREAEEILQKAQAEGETRAEEARKDAYTEGYRAGYAEGLDKAAAEGRAKQEEQAALLERKVGAFLEGATQIRDELMRDTAGELRDLAIAVAEKVIRVSLQSSSEVIMRMILAATEKLKRREWVHIYISGCDAKGMAQAPPNLTAALSAVSDHVKIVPMGDDESGTCIIEMPDEIIDSSVATQISNIKTLLSEIPLN